MAVCLVSAGVFFTPKKRGNFVNFHFVYCGVWLRMHDRRGEIIGGDHLQICICTHRGRSLAWLVGMNERMRIRTEGVTKLWLGIRLSPFDGACDCFKGYTIGFAARRRGRGGCE